MAASFASNVYAAGPAKNVIFFLGDGMGPTEVTAPRIYKYGEKGELEFQKQLDRTARIKTYSHDAQTTDSAPSMGSYMTGVKANNEVISMTADTIASGTYKPSTDATVTPNVSNGVNNCPATGNGSSVPTLLNWPKLRAKQSAPSPPQS